MTISPKAVVVLAGARDHYQLPLALQEGKSLHTLVTDMYWPADRKWLSLSLNSFLPEDKVAARFCSGLDSRRVRVSAGALCASAIMKATKTARLNRYKDKILSKEAKRIALRNQAPLFCYSYYASEAFKPSGEVPRHRFLFQLHPHPKAVRGILLEEMNRVPQAKSSLIMEHELSLREQDFNELASEPNRANGWVAASSYTARTLSDQGIAEDQIHVVPYGVDASTFTRRLRPPSATMPFTIVCVGSLIQRKGLSYLLDAVRLLGSRRIRVLLCGRGVVDRPLIHQYSDLNLELNLGLSRNDLVRQIHNADVFVLPSLAEGFAHVILEAMSCGLPIIATDHTCAPDVIMEGEQGFIVPIRDPKAIAEKLAWGIDHRSDLASMGEAAATHARLFTWERFRAGIRAAYKQMLAST